MRSLVVVVPHPFPVDVVELIKAQAKEAVQALMFVRTDVALAEGIGLRRAWRNLQASHSLRSPKFLKYLPEFLISVMNQELRGNADSVEPHCRATDLNFQPLIIGIKRGRRHENPATSEVNENQHVGVEFPEKRVNRFGEIVGTCWRGFLPN